MMILSNDRFATTAGKKLIFECFQQGSSD